MSKQIVLWLTVLSISFLSIGCALLESPPSPVINPSIDFWTPKKEVPQELIQNRKELVFHILLDGESIGGDLYIDRGFTLYKVKRGRDDNSINIPEGKYTVALQLEYKGKTYDLPLRIAEKAQWKKDGKTPTECEITGLFSKRMGQLNVYFIQFSFNPCNTEE